MQWHLAQVLAAKEGQVEQVISDAFVMLGVESVLQRLEVRHAVLAGHHHLPIEPARIDAQRSQGGDLPGHLAAPVMAVASEQANVLAIDTGQDAITVELDLVKPVPAGR
ncbi:hypothetical protein D3C78_1455790 [compost metagenome]